MIGDDKTLQTECFEIARRAKEASRILATAPGSAKDAWIKRAAAALRSRSAEILAANARDVQAAPGLGLNAAAIDRLTLDEKRLEAIAASLEEVAGLPDPVGEVIEASRRPNGLDVSKVRVPLGVIFMIYESRPNVTVDAAALCVKSGNAAILRGGKEAIRSNRAFHKVLADELAPCSLSPPHAFHRHVHCSRFVAIAEAGCRGRWGDIASAALAGGGRSGSPCGRRVGLDAGA